MPLDFAAITVFDFAGQWIFFDIPEDSMGFYWELLGSSIKFRVDRDGLISYNRLWQASDGATRKGDVGVKRRAWCFIFYLMSTAVFPNANNIVVLGFFPYCKISTLYETMIRAPLFTTTFFMAWMMLVKVACGFVVCHWWLMWVILYTLLFFSSFSILSVLFLMHFFHVDLGFRVMYPYFSYYGHLATRGFSSLSSLGFR